MGKHITEHLVKGGKHKVTAITRLNGTSKISDGVRVAKVDYSNDSSIVDALQGQDALIITLSTKDPPDTQSKLIEAAAKAGVKWIMPNEYSPDFAGNEQMGGDIMVYDHRMGTRQQIEKLGMSWVGLCCGFWYEFSLAGPPTRYGFDLGKTTLTLIDNGETKINTSTWPQCGRAVANLLALKVMPADESDRSPNLSQFTNKSVYISSFLLSQKDMLASVLRVTGGKENEWTINSQAATDRFREGFEMAKAGNSEGFPQAVYTRTFYTDGCGNYEQHGKLANDVLDLPKEDLDEYTEIAVKMAKTGEAMYH